MAKEKEPKKRADKYETKVAVKGTFEGMIAAAIKPQKSKLNKSASNKTTVK
ncbi:hypothetical protein [Dyadobacter chenhuakuii]|uniref:Uncharacterized protein n=1 Tax=Dyadobacter chenhuakuii TaxID=2909339 RepID=A0ABY4XIX9_9BACT|nr:hypothetical protein [Dyadobacter chenhuakuii]MCF2496127.1 hypothetical protein [Dyadobacter chenhuakuii]USJ30191.1 hypothetical protein NFI80_20290 [Dyadobacter chenhuakuii]